MVKNSTNSYIVLLALTVASLFVSNVAFAEEADSIRNIKLREVEVVSSPKGDASLYTQPTSYTNLRMVRASKLSSIGNIVPNMHTPDYGSLQTTAIYIRGIGSRMGTPAVGMYVDNIPYYDKSAFNFTLNDIERVDVLRGPQSTLYGRNTMGGLIKIHTKSPMRYQGTDVVLDERGQTFTNNGKSSTTTQASVTHFHRSSDSFAFSAGAFYRGSTGYFDNECDPQNTHKVDDLNSVGLRLRGIYLPSDKWLLDMNTSYEYSDEGTYPYYYLGTEGVDSEVDTYKDNIGKITNNLDGRYRRNLFNVGLNAEHRGEYVVFNSVTGFQKIDDRMFMDQDFMSADIYSLTQKQNISTISEELTLKNANWSLWERVLGLSAFYQWNRTTGPVTFRKDGVDWINGIISSSASLPTVQAGPMNMTFMMDDHITNEQLLFDNLFHMPTLSTAVFHNSTIRNIFGVDGFSATVGLRLDYEKQWLDYDAWYSFNHQYSLKGNLKMPQMQREVTMVPETAFSVDNALNGKINNDYLKLLPRLALRKVFYNGDMYAVFSKGFRSGGYNVQNISELMQQMMSTDMLTDVAQTTIPILENQPMIPADTKANITQILNKMSQPAVIDVQKACLYQPETSYNYELGIRTVLFGGLSLDACTFLCDVNNLQLSQMSAGGLGRVTVNAGKSRSIGTELSLFYNPNRHLKFNGTYGYTHSTFRDYTYSNTSGETFSLKGNRVPFAPDHTFYLNAQYTFYHHSGTNCTVGVNWSGTGRVYWNEQNTWSQPFHSQLGFNLSFSTKRDTFTIYGDNLNNSRHSVFAFTSAGRNYKQIARPRQIGCSLKWHF